MNKFGKIISCLVLLWYLCLFNGKYIFGMTRLRVGEKLKPFELKTFSGENINVKNLIGKTNIALIFWKIPEGADYIDYSRQALKYMEDMSLKYHDKGLQIVAVYCPWGDKSITREELNVIKTLNNELHLTYPILMDSGLVIYNEYGVCALPTLVLTDKKGVVKFVLPGYPTDSAEDIIKKEITNIVNSKQDS